LIFRYEVGLSIDMFEWTPLLRTPMFYSPRKQGCFVRILLSVLAHRTCDGPITHTGISNKSIYTRVIKTESGRPWTSAICSSIQQKKTAVYGRFMRGRAFTKITCLIFTSVYCMKYTGSVRLNVLKSVVINTSVI